MTSLEEARERPPCPSPVGPATSCAHVLPAVTTPRGLTREPPLPDRRPRQCGAEFSRPHLTRSFLGASPPQRAAWPSLVMLPA